MAVAHPRPLLHPGHHSRQPAIVGLSLPTHDIQLVDLSGNVVKRMPGAAVPAIGFTADMSTQLDLVCVTQVDGRAASVLNLTTGAVSVLPDDHVPPIHGEVNRAGELFIDAVHGGGHDGDVIASKCTLGWVAGAGEYKVLRVHMTLNKEQACDIFTLGRDETWRPRAPPPRVVSGASRRRVAVGGVVYFLLQQFMNKQKTDDIAMFDMATEKWKPTVLRGPLSSGLGGKDDQKLGHKRRERYCQLVDLNDHLVAVHWNYQDLSMALWFMVDLENGLWDKRYSLRYPLHGDYGMSYPLMVTGDGRIVFWMHCCRRPLKAYDLRTRTWAEIAAVEGYIAIGMPKRKLFVLRCLELCVLNFLVQSMLVVTDFSMLCKLLRRILQAIF
ncbi:hypothetical protein ACP4OV_024469 [Aristida adscensionis]